MGYGLWAMGYGLWAMGYGPLFEERLLHSILQTVVARPRTLPGASDERNRV